MCLWVRRCTDLMLVCGSATFFLVVERTSVGFLMTAPGGRIPTLALGTGSNIHEQEEVTVGAGIKAASHLQ